MSVKYISAVAFIAFLGIGFTLTSLSYFSGGFQAVDLEGALNGKASSAYEKEFDKNLKHRDISISSWDALGFVLFGEGRTGVLIGKDGWLFTNEEFYHGKKIDKNIHINKKKYLKHQSSCLKKT